MSTNTGSFQFRDASNRDAAAVQALVFGVLREYGLQPDPGGTDTDIADIEANYPQRGGWFQVIEDAEGNIVGSAGIYPLGDGVCELRKMYLRAAVRGRGLGRRLLENALAAARQRGFRRVTLETAAVLKEAIALYVRYGFKPVQGGVHSGRCDQAFELVL